MTQLARTIAAIGTRLDGDPLVAMLDVDGTLAPIAPRPEDARIPDETRLVVEAIAALPNVTVALVSGRAADDTMRIAGVEKAWVLGNHGIEVRSPDGRLTPNGAVLPYERAVANAARALEPLVHATPGALLEHKRWTLSVHYRLVDQSAVPALVTKAREIASGAGLRVSEGKKVVELRPPVQIDKGTGAVELADRLGALGREGSVLFAGDDRTDEDAFRSLRAKKPDAVTVRILPDVAERMGEGTDAEFAIDSPSELRVLLRWLLTHRTELHASRASP